jgi:hypothetical protein
MDIGTLKKLRAVVPGTLLMAGAVPLYTFWTGKTLSSIQGADLVSAGVATVVAYALGAIYNLWCLRAVFNGRSHARIGANIKRRLLVIGRTQPLTDARREELLSGKELMDVFYALVDSQESLKVRAKMVYENGLLWSSVADCVVLGIMFAALYFPLWLILGYRPFLDGAIVATAVALLAAFVLHPRAEKRHIRLSDDQLDFIATQMKPQAELKINAL